MKRIILVAMTTCLGIIFAYCMGGLSGIAYASEATEAKTQPTWQWTGTGEEPILCDDQSDVFTVSWPDSVDASNITASDVEIELDSAYGDTLTLTADTDYTVDTTADISTINVTYQNYSYTPVYTTMTITFAGDALSDPGETFSKTYDIASIYVYEVQQGGGIDEDGTAYAYSFYGFSNLTSWEQVMQAPTYTDSVSVDGITEYIALDDQGEEYLTEDSSLAESFDATSYANPQLVNNTVYMTVCLDRTEEKNVEGQDYDFTINFDFYAICDGTNYDTSLLPSPGYVIGSSFTTNEKWPWSTGQTWAWIDTSTDLYFNKPFLKDKGFESNYDVSVGTSEDEVVDKVLPSTATPATNHGDILTVNVTWSCDDYDPDVPGEYTFVGAVDTSSVPKGYTYSGEDFSTIVTVK